MKINGENYSKNYFKHSDLVKGVKIDINMSTEPNKDRGINKTDAPYSFSNER
jgi:putative alpha-1,2-mannosidase